MSDLTINISKLPEGIHTYDLESDAAELGLDERFIEPVGVHAVLSKTANQLHLKAVLTSRGSFQCDRCLDMFTQGLEATYQIVYVFEGATAHTEDTEGIELQVLPADANLIDLADDVRQYMLLGVPLKLLCKEECAGLCPTCGANLNTHPCSCVREATDPRWEQLKNIKLS